MNYKRSDDAGVFESERFDGVEDAHLTFKIHLLADEVARAEQTGLCCCVGALNDDWSAWHSGVRFPLFDVST